MSVSYIKRDRVWAYQVVGHLLYLGDEVGEELCHVLLLPGVQRLLVHGVGLTERAWVVGLPLALLHTRTETHPAESG